MLVLTHHVRLWHVYAMNILVAIGFWMFFPTVNALIQELTPDGKMLDSNSLLLAALQGGWLMAGAVVGFVYNHIGLGGVLLIDCASYAGFDRVRVHGAQGKGYRFASAIGSCRSNNGTGPGCALSS